MHARIALQDFGEASLTCEEALRTFQQGERTSALYAELLMNLGHCRVQMGDVVGGLRDAEAALLARPCPSSTEQVVTAGRYAFLLVMTGNTMEALEHLERAYCIVMDSEQPCRRVS